MKTKKNTFCSNLAQEIKWANEYARHYLNDIKNINYEIHYVITHYDYHTSELNLKETLKVFYEQRKTAILNWNICNDKIKKLKKEYKLYESIYNKGYNDCKKRQLKI